MDNIDSPWPSRPELQRWAEELNELVRADPDANGDELVGLLADARRAGRDLAWAADWLLALAREHGASLPDLAQAWSKTGRRELVHGPDARLARLSDRHGDAEAVLHAFLHLSATALPDRWPE